MPIAARCLDTPILLRDSRCWLSRLSHDILRIIVAWLRNISIALTLEIRHAVLDLVLRTRSYSVRRTPHARTHECPDPDARLPPTERRSKQRPARKRTAAAWQCQLMDAAGNSIPLTGSRAWGGTLEANLSGRVKLGLCFCQGAAWEHLADIHAR